ncbi:MAG TPA: efflux RND transporter permease subunit, partial [Pirellulales bacterium]
VENVERNLEKGLSPLQASHVAMKEISGAVMAVTLVLSFVFVPAAFISGITGEFYRQFALTIAGSTVISGLNSLSLSPALCAILLKPKPAHGKVDKDGKPVHEHHGEYLPMAFYVAFFGVIGAGLAVVLFDHAPLEVNPLRSLVAAFEHGHDWQHTALIAAVGFGVVGAVGGLLMFVWEFLLSIFFRGFNAVFEAGTRIYGKIVAGMVRVALLSLAVYGVLLFATFWLFTHVPVGFIPELDKGYLFVNIKLPDGASLERTTEVVEKVADICRKDPSVGHSIGIAGFSIVASANSTSMGTVICTLKPFQDRMTLFLRADNATNRLRKDLKGIEQGIVAVFGAPPIDGLGRAGGFKLQIQDRGNLGPQELENAAQTLIRAANNQPGLVGVTTTYTAQLPQLFLDIDRTQAKTRGVKISDVFTTLQTYVGSIYVNQINLFGRTWQVNVQAESGFRLTEEDIGRLRVRNNQNEMVPIGAIARVERISGPEKVARYNMYRSADIMGGNYPNMSTGQVIEVVDALAKQHLPPTMTIEWTDLMFQQIRAGNTSIYVFFFGGLMVYLVLAAQYESYALPFSVIMIVPMCIMCALFGVLSREMSNNIFTQVGLLVLVGLSSKNAILIVEFAKQRREEGEDRMKATIDASVARLRPILMTSACFVHMVPLYFSLGAGA